MISASSLSLFIPGFPMSLATQLFWDVAYLREAHHLELLYYHDDIAHVVF